MVSLAPGQLLHATASARPCQVRQLIGEGGQGEVYSATYEGQTFALKWYNELVLRVDPTLRRRLEVAIDMGAPAPCFLWPFELVGQPGSRRFGYLMRLRSATTVRMQAILAQEVRPSFRVLARAGALLADALLALHAKGLVYQDLNAGNVFVDAASGRIEVCDNDNVDIDGAPSVMGGVLEFQAPEVVMRRAGPSRATDLHSLAVMLFRMLHIGHPLVGARELALPNLSDLAVMRRLYGSQALFVFDPADHANRPLPEHHGPVLGHWALYPPFLRELFVRAFTAGLFDPQGRVQESEWRRALRQLHDAVLTCTGCGAQSFHDPLRLKAREASFACWHCGAALPTGPLRLGLRRRNARPTDPPDHVLVLEPGAVLYPHHLGAGDDGSGAALAEVSAAPGAFPALVNRGRQAWGTGAGAVAPGAAVVLAPGTRIDFGAMLGSVRAAAA